MITFFARHRTAANLLMLVFILLGFLAAPQLQRETFPEFERGTIRISASYPGAPTEIVDEAIVQRIESQLATVEGVGRMRSQAREGRASVNLEVADGYELEEVLTTVKAAVEAIRDFPEDVDPPSVTSPSRAASVATVAVTGPMAPQDLKLYCEQLKRELLRRGGVTQIGIAGFSTHRLRIRVDHAALARHGVTLNDVAAAVRAQSLDAPIGTLEAREGEILVRYSDRRTTPAAVAEVIIKGGESGGNVRLGELAEVTDAFAVEAEQTYFNGQRAGFLNITKTRGEDSLDVLAAVKEFIAEQEDIKPPGVALTITQDSTSVIEDRLGLLISNGVMGFVMVFLVLWLFFGLRLSFWVAMGLPISFLGALFIMLQLGHSLNMMTMLGLLVALGLLMDDGIVLADNVATHLARGKRPLAAAIDGIKEVSGGVLSSFLTTACVFVPLSAIDGRIGRILEVIPFVLLAVLAVSLIEAFFVLPNHLGHSLKHRDEQRRTRFRDRFDAGFERLRERVLGRAVDFAVKHRYVTVGATVAVLIASIGMVTSGQLRYQAFPSTEGDIVQFKLELPPGTPLERTKEEVARVTAAAWQVSEALQGDQPDGASLVANVSVRFNSNPDVEDPGPHVATVMVDLLSVEVRGTSLAEFTGAWRKAVGPLPSAVSSNFGAGGRRGPGGNALEVKIEGDDLEVLEQVSAELRAYFEAFDGVFDLSDDLQPGTSQLAVRLRPGASAMGLTGASVSSQLRTALSGVELERVFERGEEFQVFVELDHRQRDSIADLEFFPIQVAGGLTVPLGTVAEIDPDRSFARISRVDGRRTATVVGNVDRDVANVAALMDAFRAGFANELEDRYPGVRLLAGGEAEESAETLGSMGRGLIIGLFGIFILLSLQFHSYIEPFIVMLAIPFAFIGVVWGSLAIDQPLSSQAILGFVSLAGVVVNDSILLILFIKSARRRGLSAVEAACQGSRDRFRAVLLTSLTTVVGLVPLMFETSRQAQSLIPVATSIVFGMVTSTFLVLIVLPAIHAMLSDLGLVNPPAPEDEDEHDVATEARPAVEASAS